MNKQNKTKIRKIVILALMVVFAGMLLYSVYNLVQYLRNKEENKQIQELVEQAIVVDDGRKSKLDKYTVDFESLKEQNPDVVAYLKVNNTKIDYVVVKGEDNYYYLKHNFNRNWSILGWVFMDHRNNLDGNDKNIIIYGHDLTDGTMLGSLKDTLTREWQENKDNREIILITEKEAAIYEVFSTYEMLPESYYISTYFETDEDYSNFLNTLYYRSNYDFGVPVNKDDKILTLSTCMDSGAKRVVLHAKKQK